MSVLPHTQTLHRAGHWSGPAEQVDLRYDDRFFRRRKLVTRGGTGFVADFAQTVSLDHGDALELPDGTLVEIRAAPEDLYRVTGPDLVRLAWHVGNRHTPCQIGVEALLIQRDPVIGHMLEHLGATLTRIEAPFTPEGGAYGHGRTHAHEHGNTVHSHANDHSHSPESAHQHPPEHVQEHDQPQEPRHQHDDPHEHDQSG